MTHQPEALLEHNLIQQLAGIGAKNGQSEPPKTDIFDPLKKSLQPKLYRQFQ